MGVERLEARERKGRGSGGGREKKVGCGGVDGAMGGIGFYLGAEGLREKKNAENNEYLVGIRHIQNAEDNEYLVGIRPIQKSVLTSADITGIGALATLLVFNNESECLTAGEYQVGAKLSINRRKARTSEGDRRIPPPPLKSILFLLQQDPKPSLIQVRYLLTHPKMAEENVVILNNNPTPPPSGMKRSQVRDSCWGRWGEITSKPRSEERSRSHSGSCESSHRFPKRFEKDHRAQRSSRWSKSGEKARKAQPLHKPEKEDHNSVWKQLQQISHSPFSSKIKRAKLPTKFTPPNLISYNGKTDPVAYLSHYRQSMALYNGNDALMCHIFPSSLGEVALRCLKSYSARYWETYNEIDLCGEDLAVRQFKFGLPTGCKIRQSLTKKPPLNMTDLMSRKEQAQCKPRQPEPVIKESFEAVNTTFKEPIFKILPQIKDKPYFVWPPKMGGDLASRESKPYYAYHREKGHFTENCRTYKRFLEELEVFQICEGATPAPKRLRKETAEVITFTNHDLKGVQLPHFDALVVTMRIGNFDVKRILIDPGSSAEIMYDSFKGLGLGHEDLDRKVDPLYGFTGELVMPIGRVTVKDQREDDDRPPQKKCAEELVKYQLPASNQEKYFLLGASLPPEQRDGLIALLLEYIVVFAWSPYEAPGVNPAFACHSLNVDPLSRSVVQKGCRTSPLHEEAICEEVNRLIEVGAIKEILYPTWLSNTVVVKKKNGKWRVYIDFTDLNKTYPKDPFPLPKIDQLVDATSGHQRMSFLDVFQGYHQIAMNPADQEKMAFITPRGSFATNILAEDYLSDLRAVFNTLRCHRLKLNASKCAFGIGSEKFLGFMVTQRGIEANSDQITAILNLKPPKTIREVQRLTEMAAALNRFISCTAIVREEYNIQRPVYYTSKTLDGAESRYLPLEKLAFVLICSTKKLPHYFQAHAMIVLTKHPLKAVLRSADFSRRISKWGAQLGVYDIRYQPRTSIKGAGFPASNNMAEYEALLHSLRSTITLKADPLHIFCDSQLVVNQISGEYTAKDEKMIAYLTKAKRLLKEFKHVQLEHIRRDLNGHDDALASLASTVAPELRWIISVGVQNLPSVGREINSGKKGKKQTALEELHLGIGYQRKEIFIEGLTPGPIYVVFTLIPFRIVLGNLRRSMWKPYRGTIFSTSCHGARLLVALL
uniref:Uncharacterized protein n=1 Tax=Fagus sylvatica TaxID=28930 RepID=A0A2N9IFY5_FAGSY